MSCRPGLSAGAGRVALVLAVTGLLLAGCGASRPTPRAELAAYLKKVNRVEAALAPPLLAVTRAGALFARIHTPTGADGRRVVRQSERTLTQADAQITALRRRLAAVPAPAMARDLRRLLLQLIDAQRRLAHSSAQLISFLPSFSRAMDPLTPAILRLEHVLAVNQALGAAAVQTVYAEKEAALRQFQTTLQAIAARLARLVPPPVLRPSYRAQLAAVRGMSASAGRLASALAGGATSEVPGLLAGFDRAAGRPQTLGAQKAQIAAIKAYNRQIGELGRLSAQAQQVRLALADRLH